MYQRKVMLGILLACLLAGSALVVNAATQSPPVLQICQEGASKVVGSCSYQCTGNQWLQADPCQAAPVGVQRTQVMLSTITSPDPCEVAGYVSNSQVLNYMSSPRTVTIYGGSLSGGIAFSALDETGVVLAAGGAPITGSISLYIPAGGSEIIWLPYEGPPVTKTGVRMVTFEVSAPKPNLGQSCSYKAVGGANFLYTVSEP